MAGREKSIDVVKAVAIFFVIMIHTRLYAPNTNLWGGWNWVDNFVHGNCSMPMFFMLGGLFSRSMLESCDAKKLLSRLVIYIWPVFTILGGASIGISYLLYGAEALDLTAATYVRTLFSVGWFFWCISFCEASTFTVYLISRNRPALRPLLFVVLYLVVWVIPVGLFHAVEMLPFYWFGIFILRAFDRLRHRDLLGLLSLAGYTITCVCVENVETAGLMFHYSSMRLLDFNMRGFGLMISRIIFSLSGALGVFVFVRIVTERLSCIEALSLFGMRTLGVFFVHTQLLTIYYDSGVMGWCGYGVAGRIVLAVAVLMLSQAVVILTERNQWVKAVVWNPLVLLRR